jgi:hypothetical protein
MNCNYPASQLRCFFFRARAFSMKRGAVFLSLLACVVSDPTEASANNQHSRYETGPEHVVYIARDLWESMDERQRQKWPLHRSFQAEEEAAGNRAAEALLPAGVVDFLNHVTHAKAIDSVQRGFLKEYAGRLSLIATNTPCLELEPARQSKFWEAKMMNSQISYFNQLAGGLVAIDMAHHYLGHYDKYAKRLTNAAGEAVSISSVVTWDEWREAVMRGASHAITCGLSVEGLVFLYGMFESMAEKPGWVSQFVCAKANLPKIRRDLEKMEKEYFGIGAPGLRKPNQISRIPSAADW